MKSQSIKSVASIFFASTLLLILMTCLPATSMAARFWDHFNYADTGALTSVWTTVVDTGAASLTKTPGKGEANIKVLPFVFPGSYYGKGSISIPNVFGNISGAWLKAVVGITLNNAFINVATVGFFIKDSSNNTYKSKNDFIDLIGKPSGEKFFFDIRDPASDEWELISGTEPVANLQDITKTGLFFDFGWSNAGALPSAQLDIDFFSLTPEPEEYLMIFLALLCLIALFPGGKPELSTADSEPLC